MSNLSIIFLVGIIIGSAFLAWTYTKNEKKWLESL